ncbi:hypothetical protein ISU10_17720 [Nocardioides agariphilus]|uniref:Uncharacterized protein n=1 Tax=Nocardioides agariphilus TaxID=433664 RepID=A0A930VLA8_9ACTN|nr:hypothetical protein [Nocardioides agariphilus]MBF4769609.1 hypothetical protein [Nocardioides agariphilus]
MPAQSRVAAPLPLLAAASLAALEGLVIAVLGLLEVASLTSGRLTMGVTTAGFFVAYGALLVYCGWQLTRCAPWARAPVLLAQLIQLGLAWGFREGDTLPIAIGLALVSALTLAGLFHPASRLALDRE